MRGLIVKWTAITALSVVAAVTMLDAATGTAWPVLLVRAGTSFGIVALIGWGIGSVLMRTALRRRYEQSQLVQAGSRPRADR